MKKFTRNQIRDAMGKVADNPEEVTDLLLDALDDGDGLTFEDLQTMSAEQIADEDPAEVDRVLAAGPDGSTPVDNDARLDHDNLANLSHEQVEDRWDEVSRVMERGR